MHSYHHANSNQQQDEPQFDNVLLPPIRTIPSSHQQDMYPRRSSLPASLRDIMHTSVTPPTSTQVTENEESSSSEQEENTRDADPRVIQLANTLQSALNNQDASMPIILLPTQQEEEEYAFTFSFQIHRHQQDTRETLASVDLDMMNPGTIGHAASIVNAICESLSLD